MRFEIPLLVTLGVIALGAYGIFGQSKPAASPAKTVATGPQKSIVLGGGCFWCLEPLFESLKGVADVEVGYAGGEVKNPSYEQVCTGTTGHAEVFRVTYDPKQISGDDILRVFLTSHDPTTLNRQGPDSGTQYRSVIFFETPEEKTAAKRIIDEIAKEKIWSDPIVTTLEPLTNYSRAEEYHQDYYEKFEKAGPLEKMGMNAGYCRVIIAPKVVKFRKKFAHLMKS